MSPEKYMMNVVAEDFYKAHVKILTDAKNKNEEAYKEYMANPIEYKNKVIKDIKNMDDFKAMFKERNSTKYKSFSELCHMHENPVKTFKKFASKVKATQKKSEKASKVKSQVASDKNNKKSKLKPMGMNGH